MPKRVIDSELGKLEFWGSECVACNNATPGSMRCDECGLSRHTTALWMAEQP